MLGPLFLAGDEKEAVDPLPIGNFSVPTVTQVSPLISFGQLLIGKGALLSQLSGNYAWIEKGYATNVIPNVIYGIIDDLSVFLGIPFSPKDRIGSFHSSGIEDIFLQWEYRFFNRKRIDCTLQATVVANVQFPTGSSAKNPPTGNGSFTYFLGTTVAYMSSNWYAFASPGTNLTTSHSGSQTGNSYLYQCGVARYIAPLSPKGWIFDFMVEFDGTYSEKNKVHGVKNPNSGGNIIFITPSIWISSDHLIIQWGVSVPLIQALNGEQKKIICSTASTLGFGVQF
ncbi:MAG TPA: hypothetical protein VJK48_03230 [Chlamydiales bacterium]|nr:hypothetical protein [Chlamydiales bacterium]